MIKNCYICRNRKICKTTEEREDLSKPCGFCYPTEEAEMRETDAYKLGRADGKAEVIDGYLKLIKQYEDITGSIDVYKCENIAKQLKENK